MNLRRWALPALLATPLLLPLDAAIGCIRFKKPGGAVPPGLREPKDPPPPPPPTTTPPPSSGPTTPTGPTPKTGGPVTPGGNPVAPPDKTPTDNEPGAKKQAADDSTWETWWELNRIEFFPHRYVDAVVSTEGPQERGPKALAPEVVKNKLWPALMKLKDDKQVFVREAALITMGRVSSSSELAGQARAILLEALKDPNKLVARSAALGLYYVADESSIYPMQLVANDPKASPDVRAFLALTMTTLKSPMAGPLLTKLVDTSRGAEFELVAAALMALGHVPGPESARFLKDTYEDQNARAEYRAEAAESFGRRANFQDGWEVLVKASTDRAIDVRRSAVIGLGVLDYRTDAEREIAAINAEYAKWVNKQVSPEDQAKLDALKVLIPGQRDKTAKQVKEIVKRLIDALQNDSDNFVNGMAAISLGRIAAQADAPLAVKAIENDLKKQRNTVREYDILALAIAKAPDAYEKAYEGLMGKNQQPTTRCASMIAMGLLGDSKGNEVIRRVLEDEPNPLVRGYAAIALGLLGDERSNEPILSMLKTTNAPEALAYGALGLALLGKRQGSDILAKKLQDTTDGFVASHIVYSMGLMKDRKQLDALVDVSLNHKNYQVQAAAVAAIGYVSSAEDYPRRHLMAKGFNYMMNLDLIGTYFYKL